MSLPAVFITGAASGTGYAIAERFAREGYPVFITSRKEAVARKAAEELSRTYAVFAYGYGMTPGNEEAVIAVFRDIAARGYRIETLVLNAANLGIGMEFFSVDLQAWMEVLQVNLGWNFSIARQAALQMRETGYGTIVFIGSNTCYRALKGRSAYGASKGGIVALTKSLAVDLGEYGIRVNCVLPGMIKTERWQASKALQSVPSNQTPLGDIATFEDIANAVWYFGSHESRNTTGAELIVDGGMSAQLFPGQ